MDGNGNVFIEGISRLDCERYRHAIRNQCLNSTWCIRKSSDTCIPCCHPEPGSKFRPTLMHIRSTAAIIGFEAKQIRLISVCRPVAFCYCTHYLVHLLVILVSTPISCYGRWQCVE